MRAARNFPLIAELTNAPDETLLTPNEVMALSGFSKVTLRLWARQQRCGGPARGPRQTVVEGYPRYRLGDVRGWLNRAA